MIKQTNCCKCKKIIKIGEEVYQSRGKWGGGTVGRDNTIPPRIYHYLCAECFKKEKAKNAWIKFDGDSFIF